MKRTKKEKIRDRSLYHTQWGKIMRDLYTKWYVILQVVEENTISTLILQSYPGQPTRITIKIQEWNSQVKNKEFNVKIIWWFKLEPKRKIFLFISLWEKSEKINTWNELIHSVCVPSMLQRTHTPFRSKVPTGFLCVFVCEKHPWCCCCPQTWW